MNRIAQLLTIALIVALPTVAHAGPPLICHQFETGPVALLPWGDGSSWNTPDRRYDIQRLTGDTVRLLSGSAAVIARMEILRRATIYAAQDPRIANELMSAVLARAVSSLAGGMPDPQAVFDAGYLIESYKQAAHIHRYSMLAVSESGRWTLRAEPAGDGYALVVRAIALARANPEMEFAASLMKEGASSAEHRRRAAASAKPGSLLARNLGRLAN